MFSPQTSQHNLVLPSSVDPSKDCEIVICVHCLCLQQQGMWGLSGLMMSFELFTALSLSFSIAGINQPFAMKQFSLCWHIFTLNFHNNPYKTAQVSLGSKSFAHLAWCDLTHQHPLVRPHHFFLHRVAHHTCPSHLGVMARSTHLQMVMDRLQESDEAQSLPTHSCPIKLRLVGTIKQFEASLRSRPQRALLPIPFTCQTCHVLDYDSPLALLGVVSHPWKKHIIHPSNLRKFAWKLSYVQTASGTNSLPPNPPAHWNLHWRCLFGPSLNGQKPGAHPLSQECGSGWILCHERMLPYK